MRENVIYNNIISIFGKTKLCYKAYILALNYFFSILEVSLICSQTPNNVAFPLDFQVCFPFKHFEGC